MKSRGKQFGFESFLNALKEWEVRMSSGITLSAEDEKKHLVTVKPGFEALAPRLVELAREARVEIPKRNLDDMLDRIDESAALAELQDEVSAMLERIQDTLQRKRVASYKTFLAYYRVLCGMATEVPEVALGLEPVNEFFQPSVQPKKKNAPAPTPPPATVSANTDEEKAVTVPPAPEPVKVPA